MTVDQLEEASGLFREMKSGYDKATGEVAELRKRLEKQQADADQFAADMREKVGAMPKNFGGGPSFANVLMQNKGLMERSPVGPGMRFHATYQSKDILNVSQDLPATDRTLHAGPRLNLRVRSLMATMSISQSGAVQFLQETSFVNNANVVPEGSLKPQSEKTFQVLDVSFKTLAHWFRVSKQCYDDLPQLAQALSSNLVYGLGYKLEQQLLKGTGVDPQMQGIYPIADEATALPPPGTGMPADTLVDSLVAASAELVARGFEPDGAVISPADWSAMQRNKTTTGEYILNSIPSLPPTVVSPFLAAGEWLVGRFKSQSMLYIREEASVQTAFQDQDNFVRNLVTMLGEMRVAPTWFNTSAFLKNPDVTP